MKIKADRLGKRLTWVLNSPGGISQWYLNKIYSVNVSEITGQGVFQHR